METKELRKQSHEAVREKLLKEAYMDNAVLSHFPLNTTNKYYDKDIKSIAYVFFYKSTIAQFKDYLTH